MRICLILALPGILSVAACEESVIDQNTTSRFVTPSSSGEIDVPATGAGGSIIFGGQGVVYRAGADSPTGIVAVAGIIPGTTVSAIPDSGSSIYSGTFELVKVDGFFVNDNQNVVGFPTLRSGDISLTADFDDQTLKGRADDLTVDGSFTGNTLAGSVEYEGISGTLRGLIGADKAVGAFHGNDSDEIYAGGFYVTPTPD